MRTLAGLFIACLVTTTCMSASVTGHYDQATAIEYIWMSAAAYCSGNSIENWNCGEPCEKIPMTDITRAYNETHNVQAYVGKRRDNGDVIVSFRGTEVKSIKDWIENLKFAKKSPFDACTGCEVHEGFYQALNSLKPQIVQGLNKIGVTKSTPLHITGHSLGAAMSTLCAFDLDRDGYTIAQTYNFGEPRVGNQALSDMFKSRIGDSTLYRVTHWRDPVPHVPFKIMGFYHVPTEVWYNSNSAGYTVCDGSGEDKSCSDTLDFDISIHDHLHYINISIAGSCDSDKFSFNDPQNFKILSEAAAEDLKQNHSN
eukprot:gb/GECG01003148.1/.p1 GENE.gb/GECG01003148.1/~~gb/GECG01003148.1/.p1  ORF type:complete len:312 (+),score=28.51 gb/GECG01003148.1/:1-936(+)